MDLAKARVTARADQVALTQGAPGSGPVTPPAIAQPSASRTTSHESRSLGSSGSGETVVAREGTGTFEHVMAFGFILGQAGPVRHYRVAVENGGGVSLAEFSAEVDAILGDERSWIGSGDIRLRRVPGDVAADFTIMLATPVTSERLCRADGLRTQQYTSCRLSSGKVVINSARWLTAVPGYGAPLATYQAYAINHEVGHQLGHGHERCPRVGNPAPVMQQQTLDMQGCVANGWPYRNGVRYRGPAVP